jgi:hypothetical protein
MRKKRNKFLAKALRALRKTEARGKGNWTQIYTDKTRIKTEARSKEKKQDTNFTN